jgi:hypothetical protein
MLCGVRLPADATASHWQHYPEHLRTECQHAYWQLLTGSHPVEGAQRHERARPTG